MPGVRLEYLFTLYLTGKINEEEKRELMSLIADIDNEDEIIELIDAEGTRTDNEKQMEALASGRILQTIFAATQQTKRRKLVRYRVALAMAGSFLLVLAVLIFWPASHKNTKVAVLPPVAPRTALVQPGGNKALLTLADGTTIKLHETPNGLLDLKTTHIRVEKKDSALIYNGVVSGATPGEYNTLVTPRGGRYKVYLPDGSSVWLNAASSIRFPTAFGDWERVVELTGEAFFEVRKIRSKKTVPFVVRVKSAAGDQASVRVLGTAFNVSAYENERSFRVTLEHGSVKVEKGNAREMLEPGDQVEVYADNRIVKLRKADKVQETGWKNGEFNFENKDIKTIMKEISRWYDVNVIYKGVVSVDRFDGTISRYADIRDVLEILRVGGNGVEFNLEGNTIFVQ